MLSRQSIYWIVIYSVIHISNNPGQALLLGRYSCMLTLIETGQSYIPSTILCESTLREKTESTFMTHRKLSTTITQIPTAHLNMFFLNKLCFGTFVQKEIFSSEVFCNTDCKYACRCRPNYTFTSELLVANFEKYMYMYTCTCRCTYFFED